MRQKYIIDGFIISAVSLAQAKETAKRLRAAKDRKNKLADDAHLARTQPYYEA